VLVDWFEITLITKDHAFKDLVEIVMWRLKKQEVIMFKNNDICNYEDEVS